MESQEDQGDQVRRGLLVYMGLTDQLEYQDDLVM
jgi:hypothetical protein